MNSVDGDERFAGAVRALLDRPLMIRDDPAYLDVVAYRAELADYFEQVCGWAVTADVRGGTVRLHKRRTHPDPTRGAVRHSGDRMRPHGYAMLMLVASELVTRPTTTVGDLADNLTAATLADTTLPAFDATVAADRRRFVDALRWLTDAGLITVTAGDLDRYQGGDGDAVVVADSHRIPLLLSTSTPPSRVDADTIDGWVGALADEPRYRLVADGTGEADAVNRHARHMLGRALLDDPAVIVDDLADHLVTYLSTGAGRLFLRRAVARAGFGFEENADCLVTVDETGEATDRAFGRTVDIVTQVAVAVLDHLCPDRAGGIPTPTADVERFVTDLLAGDSQWAAAYQQDGGGRVLAAAAVDVLEAFQLAVRTDDAATVTATAVAGRYVTTVVDARTNTDPDTDPDPAVEERSR